MENVYSAVAINNRHIDILEDVVTFGARISSLSLYTTSKDEYRVNGTPVLF